MYISKYYIPSPPLNQFLESFFYYSGYQPEHMVDRFLPDGNIQMIFDFTDYPKYIYDNHTLKEIQACKNVWFSGFRTEPITIPSGKESEMLIVVFRKGRSYPFVYEPLHVLTNVVVDAELVLKNNILDLREALMEQPTPELKFALLESELMNHYNNEMAVNPFVDYAISEILSTPHHLSLKALYDKVGYSQKHLIKLFKDHVGVTPKEFLKVIRFQKAILELENFGSVNWIGIADECGFYDQSHFIADFKNYSGFTPKEYMELKGENLNYVPIR